MKEQEKAEKQAQREEEKLSKQAKKQLQNKLKLSKKGKKPSSKLQQATTVDVDVEVEMEALGSQEQLPAAFSRQGRKINVPKRFQ